MTGPSDPFDDKPPPKVFGPLVWILLAFSAVCVAAGAAVAWLAPRL
jgi:hypothetical protein